MPQRTLPCGRQHQPSQAYNRQRCCRCALRCTRRHRQVCIDAMEEHCNSAGEFIIVQGDEARNCRMSLLRVTVACRNMERRSSRRCRTASNAKSLPMPHGAD